jgi:WD40 repeat protein
VEIRFEAPNPNRTLLRTMGNVLVKNPTVCKHEKLNEHNERYFQKVQERNSTKTSRRHWRRLRHKRNNAWEAASLTDPSSTIEAREDETMVDPSQSDNTTSRATSAIQGQRKHSHRQYKPSVDGWEVKQKGRALKLRLAKNRCLQLAANGSLLSPISQDSSAGSRGFDPLRTPKEEDLNSEFDSLVSNGRIWVEVARATKVTAIAMSRTPSDRSKSPLLMAVGGEDGIITITEILDEQQIYVPSHGDSSVNDSSVESSRRNFGETLEFHGRGRIRSIDFSLDGQYLAIGGDGCTAYILRIIFAEGDTLENLEMLFCIERVDRIYSVQFNPNGSVVAMAGVSSVVNESVISRYTRLQKLILSSFALSDSSTARLHLPK